MALAFALALANANANANANFEGRVLSSANKPVADALVSSPGCQAVRTDSLGRFVLMNVEEGAQVTILRDGYNTLTLTPPLTAKANAKANAIYLIETARTRYSETTDNVNRKDFYLGSVEVEKGIADQITGLQVVNKSGMTGEGAYFTLRGVHSLYAENQPLIVINGMPYLPDNNNSKIIGGYSRSIFQALNNQDIRNITVLKGADAAMYGSLGGNGVILIETDAATKDNLDTRISFNAMYGTNWNSKRVPVMNSSEYKSYLSDIGLTYYDNMESFFNEFSFLTDPDANNAYLYKYNTNWQNEIYRNSKSMDFLFRVEGGDAVAKYNISLGFTKNDGTIKNTYSDRYSAQINTSILASKQFEINANINLAYLRGQYQEQGLSYETNPILAAYRRSPLLSPYSSDIYGNLIDKYSSYNYGAITNKDFIVSNPLSLVNSVLGKDRQYDVNAKVSLTYRPSTRLSFTGAVGMYYNYNQEQIFIPGKNYSDIVYLFDQYGQADNTVRVGTDHTFNVFFDVYGQYQALNTKLSTLNLKLGFQTIKTSSEYDAGVGRNTANDFYQTLSDVESVGRYFDGYNDKWSWADFYLHADYTLLSMIKLGANVSLDRASSTGQDATKWNLYPSFDAVFMAKQILKNVDFINKLDVYANYTITGNSRFSSKYAKYYYTSDPYQDIAGVVRGNIPNSELKPEKDYTFNVGIRTSFWMNRVMFDFGYYNVKSKDVLMLSSNSSVFGTGIAFDNSGEITNKGLEIALNVTPIITNDWKWSIGANLTTLNSTLTAYDFMGYQTKGVFSTSAEAKAANLVNENGLAYGAGDVWFVDQNNDGVIDKKDKVNLGSATPDCYGGFFTRLQWKGFALDMNWSYSLGRELYNATRQVTESGKDFSNQSTALNRRWSMEGQVTDIPKVTWGDAIGNNAMSDRWVENGDYLKLRSVTLSYDFNKNLWNFLQGATIYVTGENLLCFTSYLGLDPEFSYSYSSALQGIDYCKATSPRSVKFGINLRF